MNHAELDLGGTGMMAIYSTTLKNAAMLSDALQCYWGAHGLCQTTAQYETESELLSAMASHGYTSVILDGISNPLEVVLQLRALCAQCKIAVITSSEDAETDNQTALRCYKLGVQLMLTREAFEQPLELLSRGLCVLTTQKPNVKRRTYDE